MKRFLLAAVLLGLGLVAQAVELDGVKLDDSVHLGSRNLLLNGAGVRSKYIFDLYVAALYLDGRKNSAEAVLADTGEKRIALYVLREIQAEELLYGIRTGMEKNNTDEDMQKMKDALHDFEVVFRRMGRVSGGDVILLDYQPDTGTLITVNGSDRGTIPGRRFYNALLKVWLGEKPAQDELKLKLLGG